MTTDGITHSSVSFEGKLCHWIYFITYHGVLMTTHAFSSARKLLQEMDKFMFGQIMVEWDLIDNPGCGPKRGKSCFHLLSAGIFHPLEKTRSR